MASSWRREMANVVVIICSAGNTRRRARKNHSGGDLVNVYLVSIGPRPLGRVVSGLRGTGGDRDPRKRGKR